MSMASDGRGFVKTADPMVKAAMAFMAAFCKSLTTGLVETLLDSTNAFREKERRDIVSKQINRSEFRTKAKTNRVDWLNSPESACFQEQICHVRGEKASAENAIARARRIAAYFMVLCFLSSDV